MSVQAWKLFSARKEKKIHRHEEKRKVRKRGGSEGLRMAEVGKNKKIHEEGIGKGGKEVTKKEKKGKTFFALSPCQAIRPYIFIYQFIN